MAEPSENSASRLPCRPAPGGLLLFLRVTPNARGDRIEGDETRDDGSVVLRVRVSAPPDRGAANTAVIALVAKGLGIPKSALTLHSGETSRLKTLLASGDAAALSEALARLCAAGAQRSR